MLKIEPGNEELTDDWIDTQTDDWIDTQTKISGGGYNIIPHTFSSGRV